MVLCGGIAVFSVIGSYYKYVNDKETKSLTNKPYKDFYTVYRFVVCILMVATIKLILQA